MIIAAATFCEVDDIIVKKPRVLIFGPGNEIIDRVVYDVFRRPDGELDMVVETQTTNCSAYGFVVSRMA